MGKSVQLYLGYLGMCALVPNYAKTITKHAEQKLNEKHEVKLRLQANTAKLQLDAVAFVTEDIKMLVGQALSRPQKVAVETRRRILTDLSTCSALRFEPFNGVETKERSRVCCWDGIKVDTGLSFALITTADGKNTNKWLVQDTHKRALQTFVLFACFTRIAPASIIAALKQQQALAIFNLPDMDISSKVTIFLALNAVGDQIKNFRAARAFVTKTFIEVEK